MRKKNKGRILSRPKSQRRALLKSLATSLFLHGKIKTTQAKAKELRVVAEKFITRAKTNSLSNRRLLTTSMTPLVVKKLVDQIAPKYASRQGGYTRMIKLNNPAAGNSKVVLELVE